MGKEGEEEMKLVDRRGVEGRTGEEGGRDSSSPTLLAVADLGRTAREMVWGGQLLSAVFQEEQGR